ncbi:MAG: FGGY family carbohydrate kinase [Cyanobacteria bacterium P01_D01_bin.105]
MRYVIGIDIGTSSTKAVLFDAEGRQVARSAQSYELKSPEPGAAEQNPDDILQAATQTVAAVIEQSHIHPDVLLAISFSCAMHTLLLLDKNQQPITPVFTWADNRSDRYTQVPLDASQSLYERTGIPNHPMSPAIKLIWLRHEHPDVFEKAARIVCIKEYVLWHWCHEWVIDQSMASTTGLLNLRTADWDSVALTIAGILPMQLSPVVPTTYQLLLGNDYASRLGVRPNLPVIVGASDGVLANLGVGAIAPNTAAITLGTSGAVRRIIDAPTTAADTQLFCYALTDQRWVMGGAVNNGGIALQWVRDRLVPYSVPPAAQNPTGTESSASTEPSASTYERMNAMARTVLPGSDGLIFHPYLLGERAPLWNAQARASFFGLTREHSQAHFVRAVMEGVIYNLYTVFQSLEKASGPIEKLRASGGFAHSALWQQILADVFNRPIEIPTVIESSAFGAAVLALVVLGEWKSLERVSEKGLLGCDSNGALLNSCQPIPKNVSRYQKILPVYAQLSADLSHHYRALQQAIE